MTTKQIIDVKKGASDVKKLAIGEGTVWERCGVPDDFPEKDGLIAYYDSDSFAKRAFTSDTADFDSVWRDRATGSVIRLNNSFLTAMNRPETEGLLIGPTGATIPVDESLQEATYYFRMKSSAHKKSTTFSIFMQDENGCGPKVIFLPSRINFCLNTSQTSYQTVAMTLEPFEYHTFAITVSGGYVSFYTDGEPMKTIAEKGWGRSVEIVASSSITPIVFQTAAVFGTCHSAEKIAGISGYFAEKYLYTPKPESERLYLYDHGNECEAVTGGWQGHSVSSYGSFTKYDGYMELIGKIGTTSSPKYATCTTVNEIERSGYKKLFFKVLSAALPSYSGTTALGTYFGTKESPLPYLYSDAVFCENTASGLTGKYGETEDMCSIVCVDLGNRNNFVPIVMDDSGLTGKGTRVYQVWLE